MQDNVDFLSKSILLIFYCRSRGDEEYEPDPPGYGATSDETSDYPDEGDTFTDSVDLPDDVILRVLGSDDNLIQKLQVTANVLGKLRSNSFYGNQK